MCQFCAQHGDGKKWYLQAENYAYDLDADLKRRGYMVDFVHTFNESQARNIRRLDRLLAAPVPIRKAGQRIVARRMQDIHYGQPITLEDCSEVFDLATSITLMPCPCRGFSGGTDDGYCIGLTVNPSVDGAIREAFDGYRRGPGAPEVERLTKDQAMALLRKAEKRGMMHSIWTFLTPFIGAICNCTLESGCMAMKYTLDYGVKLMWRGERVAEIDAEKCTACGNCSTHCPFRAIEAGSKGGPAARVRKADCWGCGVCRASCPSKAITLAERSSLPEVAHVW